MRKAKFPVHLLRSQTLWEKITWCFNRFQADERTQKRGIQCVEDRALVTCNGCLEALARDTVRRLEESL
jgi:hypothetical protein